MMRYSIITILLLLSQKYLIAQVNIEVDVVELEDSSDAAVYLYGSFNNWTPGDRTYLLKKENNKYSIQLPASIILPIEFKFNRGSTYKVEANSTGGMTSNRRIDKVGTYAYFIQNWEDKPSIKKKYLAKLRVRAIPDLPGKEDLIYVVGNFNNWDISDRSFQLKRSRTDLWEIDIPFGRDTFLYKYHRGNWESMEGRTNGRARANRALLSNEWINDYLSMDKIESWEDTHGSIYNPYTIILGLAGLFCLFVSLLLVTKMSTQKMMGSVLVIWLCILGVGLICRAIMFNRTAFHSYPKLYVIPGLLAFYGFPLYVLFTKYFLHLKMSWKKTWTVYLFIPAILWTIYLLKFLFFDNQQLINFIAESKFLKIQQLMGLSAFLFNLPILIILKQISKKKSSLKDKELLRKKRIIINTLTWFLTVSITLLGTVVVLGLYFYKNNELSTEISLVLDFLTDLVWILIGISAIALGVFTVSLPKVFSRVDLSKVIQEFEIPKIDFIPNEEREESGIYDRIVQHMEREKPYLDSKLSLSNLASQLNIGAHQLSKILNEDFQQNFNDFINTYRIEEFKRIILSGDHPNLTLISYGYMVGFNSKSSFNRSFKRITGKTPGAFFSSVHKE